MYGYIITVNGKSRIIVSTRDFLHNVIYTYFRDEYNANQDEVMQSFSFTPRGETTGTFKCMNQFGTFVRLDVSTC